MQGPRNWGQASREKREEHGVRWRGLVSTPQVPSGPRESDTAENQRGCPQTSQAQNHLLAQLKQSSWVRKQVQDQGEALSTEGPLITDQSEKDLVTYLSAADIRERSQQNTQRPGCLPMPAATVQLGPGRDRGPSSRSRHHFDVKPGTRPRGNLPTRANEASSRHTQPL